MEIGNLGLNVASPVTLRFRLLVVRFLSPSAQPRLLGYRDGEAQLSIERVGSAPVFIVLIDGSREEERSLRLRIGRLATENIHNQHIVVVANQPWMPAALRKLGDEFHPKMNLYQLTAEGVLELKGRQPLPLLMQALRAQKRTPLPTMSDPSGPGGHSELVSVTEAEFTTRCNEEAETKERLRGKYTELLQRRGTPIAFAMLAVQALLIGLMRLWQTPQDSGSVLVQLGAVVPPMVRQGEWWRLFSSSVLHFGLLSGVLGLLVLLSLGTQMERLLGSARLLSLYVISGLGASLLTLFWPRASLVLISLCGPGVICGMLAAGAVLTVDPGGLPPAEVQRLRKIALGGLITTAILAFLPGVDRVAQFGGLVAGALLMVTGLLRPPEMGNDGKLAEPPPILWLHRGLAALCGLLLVASLATALLRGHPWQPDPSWKKRLGGQAGAGAGSGGSGTAGGTGQGTAGEVMMTRQALGQSGMSIEVPALLGEPREKGDPGRVPVYEIGDLSDHQQLLSVVVQKLPRPLKNQTQLGEALDQAVAQVKHDRLRDDRISILTPPAKATLNGFPAMEFHIRMQDTVQARGVVQARRNSIVLLWYVFTDLLPETVQLDLRRALASLKDGGPAPRPNQKRR